MPRRFYERASVPLAIDLLGLWLLRTEADGGLSGGPIVETEAYAGPDDQASHARFGRTRRNAVMFGPAGHAYVYLVYGLHHLLNVVSEGEGRPGAVLLRGLVPALGLDRIRERRGRPADLVAAAAAGPARLSQALAVDLSLDGVDLTAAGALWIGQPGPARLAQARAGGLLVGPRIGMGAMSPVWAGRPWRFGLSRSPGLSRPFPRGTAPRPWGAVAAADERLAEADDSDRAARAGGPS